MANQNSKKKKTKKKRVKASARRLYSQPVSFCLDALAAEAFEVAKIELGQAALANTRQGTAETQEAQLEAEAALEAAEELFDSVLWECRLLAIPRDEYVNLMADHPPSADEKKLLQEQLSGFDEQMTRAAAQLMKLEYNSNTFPRALLARVMTFDDEKLSDEEMSDELDAILEKGSLWSEPDVKSLIDLAKDTCVKGTLLKR